MENSTEKEQIMEQGYRHEILAKSNMFIGTKYKASALENKITYLAMFKIQRKQYEEKPDGIYVSMTSGEIRSAVGASNGGSFYETLKNIANSMTGNNMGFVNEEKKSFQFITLINKATYEDGIFTIRFAADFKDNLIDVHAPFTMLPKSIAMSFKKPWSFPLYQLLKSQCFYPSNFTGVRNNVFIVEIGLSELKLDIGVVNANQTDVRNVLSNSSGTMADYDKAVKVAEGSKEARFKRFNEFNERCITPTIEEINEVSDIYVECRKICRGKGSRVYALEFTVYLEGAQKKKPVPNPVALENGEIHSKLSDAEKFVIWTNIMNCTSEYNFSFEDVVKLAEAANYDADRVKKAVDLMKLQRKEVANPFGFVISAIKGDWNAPEPAKKKSDFCDIEEHDYDFEALEKALTSKK